MAPPAASLRHRPFGAFRLLLAFLVLSQHYLAGLAPLGIAKASRPFELGTIAVLGFFALSGFVIAEAASTIYRERPQAFVANRLLRIVPHFILAVLISAALAAWLAPDASAASGLKDAHLGFSDFSLRNILANLFGFLPLVDRAIDENFLVIGWTIRVEMAFYAVVFLWLLLAARQGFRAMLGAALAAFFILSLRGLTPEMLAFIPYFAFGAALYVATASGDRRIYLVCLVLLAAIALQFALLPARHATLGFERAVAAQGLLLATLLAAMTVLAQRRVSRLRALDQRLGDLTYPLYLYHQAGMAIVLSLGMSRSWSSFATALILSLVGAALLDMIVGATLNRWRDRLRGRSLRREPTSAGPASPTTNAAVKPALPTFLR